MREKDTSINTKDLFNANLIKTGDLFYLKSNKKLVVTVNTTGELEWTHNDENHSSTAPSTFCKEVMGKLVNGWKMMVDSNGIPLAKYRERLINMERKEVSKRREQKEQQQQQTTSKRRKFYHKRDSEKRARDENGQDDEVEDNNETNEMPSKKARIQVESHESKLKIAIDERDSTMVVAQKKLAEYTLVLHRNQKHPPRFCYDIVFCIGETCVYSSRAILCARSEHFRQLIFNTMNYYAEERAEPNPSAIYINVTDVDLLSFVHLIRYLSSGALVNFDVIKESVDLFVLADKYRIPALQRHIMEHLVNELLNHERQSDEISSILVKVAKLSASSTIMQKNEVKESILFQNRNDHDPIMFETGNFVNASAFAVLKALQSDNINCLESFLFLDTILWALLTLSKADDERVLNYFKITSDRPDITYKKNCSDGTYQFTCGSYEQSDGRIVTLFQLKDQQGNVRPPLTGADVFSAIELLLPHIRFEHMTSKDLFEIVEPTGLFSAEQLLAFVRANHYSSTNNPYSILGQSFHVPRTKRGKTM